MAVRPQQKKRADGRLGTMPDVKSRYTSMGTWNPRHLRRKK